MGINPTSGAAPGQRLRFAVAGGRLRRLIAQDSLVRYPVSVARHRIATAVFILICLAFAGYGWTTRDEAIRRRAIEFLEHTTSGEVSIARAHFTMFQGTNLEGVRISVHHEPRLDPAAEDPGDREVFSAGTVRLVHNPWKLLLGDLDVERIIATSPRITLVQNMQNGMRNWQLLGVPEAAPDAPQDERPMMTLRSASVDVIGLMPDGSRRSESESLDADVRPHPQSPTGYVIEVRRFSEPAERATVIFDPGARLVSNTPFVEARTVMLQLPGIARQFFERIDLSGQIKLSRLVFQDRTNGNLDTEIELRGVRCRIPLDMLRPRQGDGVDDASRRMTDPEKPIAVFMEQIDGTVSLRGEKLTVDMRGMINGAACTVSGFVEGAGESFEAARLELDFQATDLPMPEGALREGIVESSAVPYALRSLVSDYDPRGLINLNLRVLRGADAAQDVRVTGVLEPRGTSGSCVYFPYRVDGLQGSVAFEASRILVNDLRGRHGGGTVVVNAEIDQASYWYDLAVDIRGSNIPLDDDLFAALQPKYRSIWRRFNPRGAARIAVQLRRPGSAENEPTPEWVTQVEAEISGSEILFADYPYPLRDVNGMVRIAGDRIVVRNLSGRHGEGVVGIDGSAVVSADVVSEGSFEIDAQGLALDAAFADALPPEGRGALSQFRPNGAVDLAGSVSWDPSGEDIRYALLAKLRSATICYREFPLVIEDVGGIIEIRPDRYSVVDVAGRYRDAVITTHGEVRRTDDGYVADLLIDGRHLHLDDALYDALPDPLRRVWDLFEPKGSLGVQTALHYVVADGRSSVRHRTTIEAADAALRFRGLPVPLKHVAAEIFVSDRAVEIRRLEGRIGEGRISVSGTIQLSDGAPEASLTVTATGMKFDDALLPALPPGIREPLSSIQPSGTFDLSLDPLVLSAGPQGTSVRDFTGELVLHDASMNVGFELTGIKGRIAGRLVVGAAEGTQLDARARLEVVDLFGWRLEDLTARLKNGGKPNSLVIRDAVARAYEGEATGTVEAQFEDRFVKYQASITARDLGLRALLPPPEEGEPTARGRIDGNLVFQGRSGPGGFREGAGEVFVREAQVWKMPLMFAVFQVLNLTPDENVFHDGWLRFFISRNTLTFEKIDLQGKVLSFIGGGRMDLTNRRLDLTLLAASPMRLQLPLLSDLLEGASRELMEIRVGGTPAEPNITPQPLRSLTRALETLFPEAPRFTHPRRSPPNETPTSSPDPDRQ
jgi:hypothetical protein